MMVPIRPEIPKYGPVTRLYRLYKRLKVVRRAPYENIYYCCTQKTASQWFKAVFSDPLFYKYSGLEVFPFTYILDRRQDAYFEGPLPKRVIGTHFYIGYPNYLTIPKPRKYRTFFILRDPRDVVVSWYFSTKYSHKLMGRIPEFRKKLKNSSLNDGLKFGIDRLNRSGLFWSQRTWVEVSGVDENIRIFRYEDFARENCSFLKRLFEYMGIVIPEEEFLALHNRYAFETCSGGRKQGVEDQESHYRKGMPGDWVNYFDDSTTAYFRKVTKDLLEMLGYEK